MDFGAAGVAAGGCGAAVFVGGAAVRAGHGASYRRVWRGRDCPAVGRGLCEGLGIRTAGAGRGAAAICGGARVLAGRAETEFRFGFSAGRFVYNVGSAGFRNSASAPDRVARQIRTRSALADSAAFLRRADGDGGVRGGAAQGRAQHAGALEFESGYVIFGRRRTREDAGPGAGARAERGADSERSAVLALRGRAGADIRGDDRADG